jgi:hypothetical protein
MKIAHISFLVVLSQAGTLLFFGYTLLLVVQSGLSDWW